MWHLCRSSSSSATSAAITDARNADKKEWDDSAPVSDSVPLRVLDLYILVHDGIKSTLMRSKPYTLCLRRPPAQWAWGVDLAPIHQLTQAMPNIVYHAERKFYEYNDAEGEAIWCMPSSYEGKQQCASDL